MTLPDFNGFGPTPPYRHRGYIQTIEGGKRGFFASCPTCGCEQFPNRHTRDEAQADIDAHYDRYRAPYDQWIESFA